jgi:hypothetical protein
MILINIKVIKELIREGEVKKLAGDPVKLEKKIGKINFLTLNDTFLWMLNERK